MNVQTIKVSAVVFRKDLYPRIEHSQQKAQEYAEAIEALPPIELNQHLELIDGFHRWTAHKLVGADEIGIFITETASDDHLIELAIERNAAHGLQLSQADKRRMAIQLYARGERGAERKQMLARLLSVSVRAVNDWVSDLDQAEREERRRAIQEKYLQCYTEEEIAEAVGVPRKTANDQLLAILEDLPKSPKVTFSEENWQPPIYNVWTFAKKTNETTHFGNSEQRIVENLIYLYTNPLEIVVDPFGGGGSTLDVCRGRARRCWISDRKPKPGMEGRIRTLDVCQSLPELNKRWADVSLVYLDPPYWRQAAGQYSEDAEDLANMPLEEFTEKLCGVVNGFAKKMRSGATIALLIQPTQWKSDGRAFADHITDIIGRIGAKRLILENRVSCPYSTEQCTPQMVEWAKENRKLLVISRELIIWKVA